MDNRDADIKATLLTTSLHGTARSLNQHPTTIKQGESREIKFLIQKKPGIKKWYNNAHMQEANFFNASWWKYFISFFMDRFSLHFDSLNPGQTAVVGFDQPLYVVVKRI